MTGWLPAPVEELFGAEASAEESYEVLTVDVPVASWLDALRTARDELGCTYFDWLSAVDEPGTGFRVSAHVVALAPVRRLLVRTTVPHEAPVLPTAVDVYAGAAWHERETHEMFGVGFDGHPHLVPLLLPEGFEGHPLRKDFVLAARVAKAWPGAKEPGESEHGGPKRRQMLPPGVPDPNEWGPLKGQLPAAPARPARGAGRAAGAAGRAAGERPARRTRTAGEGSASQAEAAPAPARRARSVSQGSASQRGEGAEGAAPAAEAAAPAAPVTPAGPATPADSATPAESAAPAGPAGPAVPATEAAEPPKAKDEAPWHNARPAFDETKPEAAKAKPEAPEAPEAAEAPEAPEAAKAKPEAPEAPKAAEAPEAPKAPETAEAPAEPDAPAEATAPAEPPAPTEPDDPDNRPGGPQ
ncbi:NADH-quinone oxidoreductase subunit C [Streptomyces sp. NPDC127108]|uniref:NADH-quinone oxidoreductase subunit C n=1 Tax=Streptomyces sp. NPDC127108 TaxID=3345361 RepID=UPI0036445712